MLLDPASDPLSIIAYFNMGPHPEGGWYTQPYRSPAEAGARPVVSAIYFLLQQGERSNWHTVDAVELWLWHAGPPVRLHLEHETLLLGPDVEAGQRLQAAVPEEAWQSAESAGRWSLVSCVVAPAFEFAGFRLAPPGWMPKSIASERD